MFGSKRNGKRHGERIFSSEDINRVKPEDVWDPDPEAEDLCDEDEKENI